MRSLLIASLSLAAASVVARVTPTLVPASVFQTHRWENSKASVIGNSTFQSVKLTCPGLTAGPNPLKGLGSDCLHFDFAVDEEAKRILINGVEVYPKRADRAVRLHAMDSHHPPCEHSVGYVLEMLHVTSTNYKRWPGFIGMSMSVVDVDSIVTKGVPDVSTTIVMDNTGALSFAKFEIKEHGTSSMLQRLCDIMTETKNMIKCCAHYYIQLIKYTVSTTSTGLLVATGTAMAIFGLVLGWFFARRRVDLPMLRRGCFFKRFALKSGARACCPEKIVEEEEEEASLMSNQETHSPLLASYRDHRDEGF